MVKRGFGTNFHKIYGSDPSTYHSFSAAEHFSPQLAKRIKELSVDGALLDIACGSCHKTNLISPHFTKVFALDYSKPLLEFALHRYGRNKKLTFLWSSAACIPLLDESVDTVLVTWGSFPLSKTIREMQRVVKRGGSVIRIGAIEKDEFTALFPKFDITRIRRINGTFAKSGFTIESHRVTIQFKNITEAQMVLSTITGAPSRAITRAVYHHNVALCYYKKP